MVLPNIVIACVCFGAFMYFMSVYNRPSTEHRGRTYQYHRPPWNEGGAGSPESRSSDRHRDSLQHQWDSMDDCLICMHNIMNGTSRRLHCGHVYHAQCIDAWFEMQRTCPLCRAISL